MTDVNAVIEIFNFLTSVNLIYSVVISEKSSFSAFRYFNEENKPFCGRNIKIPIE